MKELNCDIHIVGGALTGLLTAYSASKLGYSVIVSEKKKINLNSKKITTDTRTTAISEGSKNFLESQGVWKLIKNFAEPIKQIKVIDKEVKANIDFMNPKSKSNLGYIVKNSKLINILLKEITKKRNVHFLFESSLHDLSCQNSKIIGFSNEKKINAKLVIAADGKKSAVRELLGTNLFKKNYKEKALVVNFFHEKPHNNIAYEFFFKNGPLAILPMQREKSRNQSALIWSNTPELVDLISLKKLQMKYIEEVLTEKIFNQLGSVLKISSIQSFPLSAHINEKFYEDRIIYAGDAAHSIHPIAGQGWNLGLRDVKSITSLLIKAKNKECSLGTKEFCKKYNALCYYDAYRLFEITDKLNWIFKKNQTHYKFLKKIGLNLINNNRSIKNKIANFAMGI